MKSLLIGLTSLLCAVGCSSDVAVGGPGGSAGASSSSAGASSSSAGASSSAAGAPQDPRTEAASYAKPDVACTTDTDCCLVIDQCTEAGLVVSSSDKDTVKSLLESASMDRCVACIAPMVQVTCNAGRCVGHEVDLQNATSAQLNSSPDLGMDHCGTVATTAPLKDSTSHFGCGG